MGGASAACASPRAKVARTPPPSVCGHWVVAKVIATSNIQGSPNKSFLGEEATYLASKAQFGRRFSFSHPLYRERLWSRAAFRHAYVSARELRIRGERVAEVDVLDPHNRRFSDVGDALLVRNGRQIITLWNGVFYES